MKTNILYLFKNTRAVILAQKSILNVHNKCKIIPVPRNISSECGMCIEVIEADEKLIDSILTEKEITFSKTPVPHQL